MSRKSRQKAQKKKRLLQKPQGAGTSLRRLNAELPLHGAWALDVDIKEQGMTSVVIARRIMGASLAFGNFLIDVWGIGLKDCFGEVGLLPIQFEREVLRRAGEFSFKPCELAYAQRLIWGGVDHAEAYGFRLPKAFRGWRNIVGRPPADAPPIEFGRDGRLFIMGDMDDIARRMGTTPQQAAAKIAEHGDFVFGINPADAPVVEITDDDEAEEDADFDVENVAPPRRRLWLPGQK